MKIFIFRFVAICFMPSLFKELNLLGPNCIELLPINCKYSMRWKYSGFIYIGCKGKLEKRWDWFFKSESYFVTYPHTPEYKNIVKVYYRLKRVIKWARIWRIIK